MLNTYFTEIKKEYLFAKIERILEEYKPDLKDLEILNFGIGDIAKPLSKYVAKAICTATLEMAKKNQIRGYGPSQGYSFLREAILKDFYGILGFDTSEIFISEGANNDLANICELFSTSARVAIPTPAYPVYFDINVMAGRAKNISLLPCLEKNNFAPSLPETHADLIYLCSPNNPTGEALNKKELSQWVEYAKEHQSLILYDSAYSDFIRDPDIPKSIFEIPEAKKVAIEFKSFSKSAGFTGLRCGYTVMSKDLAIWPLWKIRQDTKSNGVSYPIQRGAEAALQPQGKKETKAQVDSYLEVAKILKNGLEDLGQTCFGGINSPYIWWKIEGNSWNFFHKLLKNTGIIALPGKGFGDPGEGFMRLSAFSTKSAAKIALTRLKKININD